MNGSRRTGAPHRGQGSPARPYTARARSKYPLSPSTFTYRLSNEVPPARRASANTSCTPVNSAAICLRGGGDVRDRRGQLRAARREGQVAERPLVGEPQVRPAVGEREPDPHVRRQRLSPVGDQQLAA